MRTRTVDLRHRVVGASPTVSALLPASTSFCLARFLDRRHGDRREARAWTSEHHGDNRIEARAGEWLVGGGLVLGLAAAVAGLVDFLAVRRAREHIDGWMHAAGNATVLTLALANLLIRRGDYEDVVLAWGVVLSIVTVLLLTVTSWYGGELAHRHMIGVTGHGDATSGEAAGGHQRAHEGP